MQRGSARANNRREREHARMAVSKACSLVDGSKWMIGMRGRNDDQDWKTLELRWRCKKRESDGEDERGKRKKVEKEEEGTGKQVNVGGGQIFPTFNSRKSNVALGMPPP